MNNLEITIYLLAHFKLQVLCINVLFISERQLIILQYYLILEDKYDTMIVPNATMESDAGCKKRLIP